MRARDVMTTIVHTVTPDSLILDAARLLVEHRIGAAPVLGPDGAVVGIVSESDLMRRVEIGTGRHRSWLAQFLADPQVLAAEYVREQGPTVASVMSREVVTVEPDTGLDEVADRMERHAVKRVPVIAGGRLVGIVSRADLVRAIAIHGTAARPASSALRPGDADLRQRLLERLQGEPWFGNPTFEIAVEGGAARLWGVVRSEDERRAMIVAAQTLPGIGSVTDHLTVARWDIGI